MTDSIANRQPTRPGIRSPWTVTLSVWKAMFLRESLGRLFDSRASWAWLLLEPLVHIGYMVALWTLFRVRTIGGIDLAVWAALGFLAFFMFRRTAGEAMRGVGASAALFTYRQVKPVDAVLVRAALEGALMVVVTLLVLTAGALLGYRAVPDDPLMLMLALAGMWLIGLGFGLLASVANELIPELGKALRFSMRVLYLISGIMFPLSAVPPPLRDWLLLNPVAHGVEAARQAMADYYHAVPGLSLSYVYEFALVSIFLGLALHRRFALRLLMK